MTPADILFWANVVCNLLLLVGAVWCVAVPTLRIYPMSAKGPLYYAMWLMFWWVFGSGFALVVLDWNTGPWTSPLRLVLGVPLALVGGGLVSWGIATLGVHNTSALPGGKGFVDTGPYAFTRNPQYLGDILLFAGVSIIANSELVLVTHALVSLVFLVAPAAEEPWLEEQYGEAYRMYRGRVPRFA